MIRYLTIALATLLALPLAAAPSNQWITISLVVFKQKLGNPFQIPASVTFSPKWPPPAEQMARNINAMQLPVLHHATLQSWQSKLKDAGYEIVYGDQWQQPAPSSHDSSRHYLLDYEWQDQAADETSKHDTVLPTPESTETAPTPELTQYTPDTTQNHLHTLLPQLFANQTGVLVPQYNPWVHGTITIEHNPYYKVNLNLYGYDDEASPRPRFQWRLSKHLRLNETRYIDHDHWGIVLQIKQSRAPASLSSNQSH